MDIKPNTLSLIALCREYCAEIEGVDEADATEFVRAIVRLLPRIYIAATDLDRMVTVEESEDQGLDNYLEEDYYESLRFKLENLFGPDDVYLEVFESEMKYSDTPIRASLAEGLCDLFQTFYNFTESVKGAFSEDLLAAAVNGVRDEFESGWSQMLVNVMRPLNAIVNRTLSDDEY